MTNKTKKKLHYIATGIATFFFAMGGIMYLIRPDFVQHAYSLTPVEGFNSIGFPSWLILPLGLMKISGAIAMWAPIPKWLREWAYAGMFFNLFLALGAHAFNPLNPNDYEFVAIVPLTFVIISRMTLGMREVEVS